MNFDLLSDHEVLQRHSITIEDFANELGKKGLIKHFECGMWFQLCKNSGGQTKSTCKWAVAENSFYKAFGTSCHCNRVGTAVFNRKRSGMKVLLYGAWSLSLEGWWLSVEMTE